MITRHTIPEIRADRHFAVAYYYHTGEPINPYRCEACITKKQLVAWKRRGASVLKSDLADRCCRKCGRAL